MRLGRGKVIVFHEHHPQALFDIWVVIDQVSGHSTQLDDRLGSHIAGGGLGIIFVKQKPAYEVASCLVGSEMCKRNRLYMVLLSEEEEAYSLTILVLAMRIMIIMVVPEEVILPKKPLLHNLVLH